MEEEKKNLIVDDDDTLILTELDIDAISEAVVRETEFKRLCDTFLGEDSIQKINERLHQQGLSREEKRKYKESIHKKLLEAEINIRKDIREANRHSLKFFIILFILGCVCTAILGILGFL
jgi:hypothetical protein